MVDMKGGMFTSLSGDWRTPKELYEQLDKEFHFDFDPCPADWDGSWDGRYCDWGNSNYVNPPYGRGIIKWVSKAVIERLKGKLSVFLLPARTDTAWFHLLLSLTKPVEIRFIKGRLHFSDSGPAPFPSMVVVFRP